MDLNDFLRNTKTAAAEGARAALAGHKRQADGKEASSSSAPAAAGSSSGADATAKRPRRSGTAEGLNLQAAQEALALERGTTSAQALQQRAQADLLSEQAAARMVHQVLEYVMQAELGGRHNAAKGGAEPFVPSAAQLAAERAMWAPAAGYAIQHVVPAPLNRATPTLDSLVSVVEKERVPEGVRTLRSSLQVCDTARDLVGGVRSGMAPHLRAHVLEVLEKGLRGEAWLRDDAAVATQFTALGKPTTPEKGPSSVVLFGDAVVSPLLRGDERRGLGCSAALAQPPSQPLAAGFSLSAFLDAEGSSPSSDEAEDAT